MLPEYLTKIKPVLIYLCGRVVSDWVQFIFGWIWAVSSASGLDQLHIPSSVVVCEVLI